ncbi:unnamed protein product [Parajaminaea phylloscopi]
MVSQPFAAQTPLGRASELPRPQAAATATSQWQHQSLIHAEILSVTTSIRKYTRLSPASSTSSLGFGSSSANSSLGSSSSHTVPLGSHSAALSSSALAHARRRLADYGADHSFQPGGGGGGPSQISTHGLKTALSARAKEMDPTNVAGPSSSSLPRQKDPTESLEPTALLHSFTILRAQLKEHPELATFPLPLLLAPFLHVILSPRVSAPVTSAALQSVNRLLVYQVVPLPSSASASSLALPDYMDSPPGLRPAVVDIANAVSHCRFEPSEPAVDELVLLRILAVMKELVCGTRQIQEDGQGLTLADFLPDESICEMMETGLSMCCQTRLSDLLRKTAEQHLLPMVRHIFSRLQSLPLTDDDAYDADKETTPDHLSLAADDIEEVSSVVDADEKRMRRMTMPDPRGLQVNLADTEADEAGAQAGVDAEQSSGTIVETDTSESEDRADDTQQEQSQQHTQPEPTPTISPFSLPAIKEVLRVIISLLDPAVSTHTDSMRLLGLTLLTAALETAGPQLSRFPSLRAQLQDTGCKYLLQLSKSESFAISSYSIRCICTLVESIKTDLKLQYELLLTTLMDRLAPVFPMSQEPWNEPAYPIASAVPARLGPQRSSSVDSHGRSGTPDSLNASTGAAAAPPPPPPPPMPRSSDKAPAQGDTRDLMLEALALLFGTYKAGDNDPLLELFLNFDCDVDCDDLYQRAMHFLCRSVFASPTLAAPAYGQSSQQSGPVQDGVQVFALDIVLSFVERLTQRQEDAELVSAQWPEDYPSEETLEASRGRKDAILEGARRFNAKPRDGLAFFQEQGLISPEDSDLRDRSVARFLMECPRLDKKLLGDYLSRPDNVGILEAFIRLFDFQNKPLSEAMREMLESFRLPGESQQINRIAEIFSKVYFATSPKEVKSEDAVYVLAYSVIMLNTDLHNSQNKRKMKVEDYRRNLRGVNDGSDFDPDYLGSIYENIRKREIVMPEEHVGQLGFDYAWKELLRKSRSSTPLRCPPTTRFDREMFATSWKPIVACIAYAFSTFRDEHLLERAISAFRQCGMLASKWGMDEVFDFMIEGLATNTGLLDGADAASPASVNNAIVEVEGVKVSVSSLSVRFGLDFKGQLAAVVLFTIAHGNGEAIRAGWTPIFEIFKNLFAAGLLPDDIAGMLDVTSQTVPVNDDGKETPKASSDHRSRHRTAIPLKPKKSVGIPQPDPRAQGGGLFSTLSSYLLSPYSNASEPAAPEVTEADIESSLCAVDCVASCRVKDLYTQLMHLRDRDSVLSVVQSLRQLADRLTLGQLAAAAAASQQYDGTTAGQPAHAASSSGATRSNGLQQLPYDPRAIFVLELLTDVTCASPNLIEDTWSESAGHLQSLLQSPKNFHPALLERTVICLLRIIDVAQASATQSPSLQSSVASALDLLRGLPSEIRPALSPAIIGGLQHILSVPRETPFVDDAKAWDNLLALVSDSLVTRTSASIELAYNFVSTVSTLHLSLHNFVAVVQLLRDVAQTADPEPMLRDVQKREKQGYRLTLTEKKELTEYVEACRAKGPLAIKRLDDVKLVIPALLSSDVARTGAAWSQCWLTLTSALASQCINAHRGTRQEALTALQRVVFSSELSPTTSPPWGLRQIFLTAIFPILDQLVPVDSGAAVFAREQDPSAPGGLFETRLRACALLCRTMLHFLEPLHSALGREEFHDLWTQVLDWMERFYRAGAGHVKPGAQEQGHGGMIEAVPENVKNVLLVLHATGILVPPPSAASGQADSRTPDQAAFWAVTFDRLDKFLPAQVTSAMRDDLAPVEQPAAAPAVEAHAEAGDGDGDGDGEVKTETETETETK